MSANVILRQPAPRAEGSPRAKGPFEGSCAQRGPLTCEVRVIDGGGKDTDEFASAVCAGNARVPGGGVAAHIQLAQWLGRQALTMPPFGFFQALSFG